MLFFIERILNSRAIYKVFMRIPQEQLSYFKTLCLEVAPESKVYLFGSRLDDTQKGGDIDIMVLTDKKLSIRNRSHIRYGFYEKYGEQKLDLVNFTFDEESPFKNLVLIEGVEIK